MIFRTQPRYFGAVVSILQLPPANLRAETEEPREILKGATKTGFLKAKLDNRLAKASGSCSCYVVPYAVLKEGCSAQTESASLRGYCDPNYSYFGSKVWVLSNYEVNRLESWQNIGECVALCDGNLVLEVWTCPMRWKYELRKVEALCVFGDGHGLTMTMPPDELKDVGWGWRVVLKSRCSKWWPFWSNGLN